MVVQALYRFHGNILCAWTQEHLWLRHEDEIPHREYILLYNDLFIQNTVYIYKGTWSVSSTATHCAFFTQTKQKVKIPQDYKWTHEVLLSSGGE